MGQVREGYLLLADISGYTSFLTGTELEHAQGIMEDLTRLILQELAPPLKLVKLEGDAVFSWAPAELVQDSERLVEQVERCYFEFAGHLEDIKRATACKCVGCSRMLSLDLKFLVHYGRFVTQKLAGTLDLAGPDVILVHRLLKNEIVARTGLAAYAFFSDAALARCARPLPLQRHTESYEHLGEVQGGVLDLRAALATMREARREYLETKDADMEMVIEVSAPPAVVWEYFVDPVKKLRWETGFERIECAPNAHGRIGSGAVIECAHGRDVMLVRLLDARPFRYLTVQAGWKGKVWKPPPPFVSTMELQALPDGRTRIVDRTRWVSRNPLLMLAMQATKPMMRKELAQSYQRLAKLVAEDARAAEAAARAVPEAGNVSAAG